jgi:hypothetical protein
LIDKCFWNGGCLNGGTAIVRQFATWRTDPAAKRAANFPAALQRQQPCAFPRPYFLASDLAQENQAESFL